VERFGRAQLRRLAGPASFERGLDYVDAVKSVRPLPDGVVATVEGTDEYRVLLRQRDGLSGECTCPYGLEGNFCKHCVAVGLYVLQARHDDESAGEPATVRAYLETLSREQLADLVWRATHTDPDLYHELRVAAAAGGITDFTELDRLVESLDVGWLERDQVRRYANETDELLTTIEGLIAGHPVAAQRLLRRATEILSATASQNDDEIGYVDAVAERAAELYLRACRVEPPEQPDIARWLLRFRIAGPDYQPESLALAYDLLDETGWAIFRDGLAQAARDRPRDWRIRRLREQLAAADGDTDALIEVWAEELIGPMAYVRIATLLLRDNRVDEAVGWLERGLADGHGNGYAAGQLVDVLAELYAMTGRLEDRLALREKYFAEQPTEQTYAKLREAAGAREWPAVRLQAQRRLRELAQEGAYRAADIWAAILLGENRPDEAWAVIDRYPTEAETREAVADRRARTHPADAIRVYKSVVDDLIKMATNDSYRLAADHIAKMRPWFPHTGATFSKYVASLREEHRRKRNFLAELDEHGL
jgi:uncharacterized Zn finger protein